MISITIHSEHTGLTGLSFIVIPQLSICYFWERERRILQSISNRILILFFFFLFCLLLFLKLIQELVVVLFNFIYYYYCNYKLSFWGKVSGLFIVCNVPWCLVNLSLCYKVYMYVIVSYSNQMHFETAI